MARSLRHGQQLEKTADLLHSAAIRVLRGIRSADEATGLSGPRLSALSVLVFRGPLSIGDLAAAEQVRPPTISRMMKDLEYEGLVRRRSLPADRRVQMVSATAAGRRLLERGRRRRVQALAGLLADLAPAEQATVRTAAQILLRIDR
jgi:DNA-binding MarR family transcriptional regulator